MDINLYHIYIILFKYMELYAYGNIEGLLFLTFFQDKMRKWYASICVDTEIGRDPKLVFWNSPLRRKVVFPLLTLHKKPSLFLSPWTVNPFLKEATECSVISLDKLLSFIGWNNLQDILTELEPLKGIFALSRVVSRASCPLRLWSILTKRHLHREYT